MIYLVHHGAAASPDVDPQRPLTEAGRAGVERVALAAAAGGATPEAIWHSGKLRARQTGEVFRHACNPLALFTMVRGLQPNDPPDVLADRVTGETRDLMLVGHLPHIARLFNRLVGENTDEPLDFPLHGVVALEQDPNESGGVWHEVWRVG